MRSGWRRRWSRCNLMWLEDLITGDYTPYVAGRRLPRGDRRATTTPIHTGEQIYLRQNFKELIETPGGATSSARTRPTSAASPS